MVNVASPRFAEQEMDLFVLLKSLASSMATIAQHLQDQPIRPEVHVSAPLRLLSVPSDGPRHSPCFSSVSWNGQIFTFTPKQRSIIAALWEAWENGSPHVSGAYLLDMADCETGSLRHIFRGSAAWRSLILPGEMHGGPMDTYCLATALEAKTETQPSPPSHSPDFTSILQDGVVYSFSLKQRIMVSVLWKAREEGYRWVGGDRLLQEAESEGSKVNHLFRGHPAWGKLILSGALHGETPGTYALALPKSEKKEEASHE